MSSSYQFSGSLMTLAGRLGDRPARGECAYAGRALSNLYLACAWLVGVAVVQPRGGLRRTSLAAHPTTRPATRGVELCQVVLGAARHGDGNGKRHGHHRFFFFKQKTAYEMIW